MAIILLNRNQKEYHVAEQMLENHSNAAVVHPMRTDKSVIDGEVAETQQNASFRGFSHGANIFKTSCESVRRNFPEKDLFRTALFTYVKRLCCSRQERETMAAQKPDFIILNARHRVCVSNRNVQVEFLIQYLDAQKKSVEHFFRDCVDRATVYRQLPRIDISCIHAAKYGNLQAPKFCVPPGDLELGA